MVEDMFPGRAVFPNRSFHIAAEVGLIGEKLLSGGQGLSRPRCSRFIIANPRLRRKNCRRMMNLLFWSGE